jgi:hypothetical protein
MTRYRHKSHFQGLMLDRRQVLGGAGALALAPLLPLRADEADPAARASAPQTRWPSRALLAPDLSCSRDTRNLAKTAHEQIVLDDMENDGAWTASPPVTLAYSTERARTGTRSLRMRVALRNEEYIRRSRLPNGSFTGLGVLFDGTPFSASVSKTFDKPQDWTRYNRLSLWCFVHPTTNPVLAVSLQFLCEGASAGPTDPIAITTSQISSRAALESPRMGNSGATARSGYTRRLVPADLGFALPGREFRGGV